jgi:hypothetical protein
MYGVLREVDFDRPFINPEPCVTNRHKQESAVGVDGSVLLRFPTARNTRLESSASGRQAAGDRHVVS